ncbi:MAG: glycine zipper family protein [Syntrophaceae bacterium]|nr:glycine zipper family protein [Syntrophaceae bacterium]
MGRRFGGRSIACILLAVFWILACTRYESQVVPFKMPKAYPNAVEVDGTTVAAQAFGDPKTAKDAFGFDILGAGVLPVMVVFDNRGDRPLDIVPAQTFLVDQENNLWPVLDQKVAYERIERQTELGEVAPKSAKYGVLGGIAGGLIGAAIGIVSGQSVGEAAMRGAAVGAAAGASVGGTTALSQTDVQARIRDDLNKRSLENRSVRPKEIAYGFIFFPAESKKPVELRIQLREGDTGKLHALIMKL